MSADNQSEDTRECEAMRKMFVGGLNRETTEESFNDHFGKYGNMLDSVIIKDTQTKVSRGFGFVTYETSDSVEKVFQDRPHEIDGKTLDVKRAMPREYNTTTAHAKVTKLFIGGVSSELTPEELQEYIESRHPREIGTIDKIDFIKDKKIGFLECSDTDFADRLTISENSFYLNGKRMGFKKAEPKNEGGGNSQRGGGGGGRGGARGGMNTRGGGRGGQGNGYGGYGQGQANTYGGYNQAANGFNNYATAYPVFGANTGFQQAISSYAAQATSGYGSQGRGGYGGNRFAPY